MDAKEKDQMIENAQEKPVSAVSDAENDKVEDPGQLGLFAEDCFADENIDTVPIAADFHAVSVVTTMNPETEQSTDAQMSEIESDEQPILHAIADPHASAAEQDFAPAETISFGQRLRAAREARGWSREDAAGRLRLPTQIIQSLEAESYEHIQHSIYLRGYLKNYTRLLDIPQITIDKVLREHGQTPQLVSTGKVSRSRYLFDRYSVSALYLILTGVIIVPAVMLAMRTTFEPNIAQFAPLDAPQISSTSTSTPNSELVAASGNNIAIPPESRTPAGSPSGAIPSSASDAGNTHSPLIASMAPFSAATPTGDADAHAATTVINGSGKHTLKLTLKAASWVEIVGSDGEKLEYGLLPAGTERSYASNKALDVRLGNGIGAQLEIDGKHQDLSPYQRANVAHFKLFSQDQLISRTDT